MRPIFFVQLFAWKNREFFNFYKNALVPIPKCIEINFGSSFSCFQEALFNSRSFNQTWKMF